MLPALSVLLYLGGRAAKPRRRAAGLHVAVNQLQGAIVHDAPICAMTFSRAVSPRRAPLSETPQPRPRPPKKRATE